jgi:putative redox protein
MRLNVMQANSIWDVGYKSIVDNGRGHSLVVDLPKEEGGSDTGPTALELAAMSLAGCITTIFKMIAVRRHFEFDSLKVQLDCEKADDAVTITKVKGTAELMTRASESDAQTILNLTLKTCSVGAFFKEAGIPVYLDLRLKSGPEESAENKTDLDAT